MHENGQMKLEHIGEKSKFTDLFNQRKLDRPSIMFQNKSNENFKVEIQIICYFTETFICKIGSFADMEVYCFQYDRPSGIGGMAASL